MFMSSFTLNIIDNYTDSASKINQKPTPEQEKDPTVPPTVFSSIKTLPNYFKQPTKDSGINIEAPVHSSDRTPIEMQPIKQRVKANEQETALVLSAAEPEGDEPAPVADEPYIAEPEPERE